MTVSDASPLISLARIGAFSLLQALFSPELVIPPAVHEDVVTHGRGRAGEAEVLAGLDAGWIQLATPASLIAPPYGNMRPGELEAVSLACELNAELLIDEGPGRKRAIQEGLAPYGTLDVLILSKAQGHIDAVRPHVDALMAVGFYLKPDLRDIALQKAGENL